MFKISTRGQYALLIMEDLAENTEENDSECFVPLRLLSHRRNLSTKYLEQILAKLVAAKLVEGSRGINGGYRLTRPADKYTVGDILRVMEGDLSPLGNFENNTVVSEGSLSFWKDFETTINQYVDSIHLDELAEKNKEFIGYDYCI